MLCSRRILNPFNFKFKNEKDSRQILFTENANSRQKSPRVDLNQLIRSNKLVICISDVWFANHGQIRCQISKNWQIGYNIYKNLYSWFSPEINIFLNYKFSKIKISNETNLIQTDLTELTIKSYVCKIAYINNDRFYFLRWYSTSSQFG